jgi:glycosyltransferase involved in cell wall biosynthesis
LRIAVFENLPPGGALRAAYEIGRQLVERGHSLHLFRLSAPAEKGPFDLALDSESVHVEPFRPLWGALNKRLDRMSLAPRSYTLFGPLRKAHRRLATLIREGDFDAVLLHQDALAQSPYALRWLSGLPTVYYCQEPPRFVSERSVLEAHREHLAESPHVVGLARLADDRLTLDRLAKADHENARDAKTLVVNSVYSRERVWAAYARDAVVCYLGIDDTRFTPAAESIARRREVVSVGLPISAKGHAMVVEALALLPPDVRPALRVILPRHAGTDVIERLAKERHVELSIEVSLSEEKFVERYRGALATVCAARLEPFGLTPLESMACGTPVVAIREGGYRESVVDGETGFLVEPDPQSIADGILRLGGDRARVETMGRRGREEVVRRWTWHRTGDQMEEILKAASSSR